MSISRKDVEHLARLAHLELDAAEAERLAADLDSILDYARRLAAVPEDVGEGDVPSPGTPLREDEPGPRLPPGAAVAPAPERSNDLFKVPPAIGGA
jgi:aspartyl-tRNA(Asn)/glutamyl-tRNA(Gln) amidotransferase subunit C